MKGEEIKEKAIEKADEILIMLGRMPGKTKLLDYGEENEAAYHDLVKIARSVGMEITNETAISTMFCVNVMRRLEETYSQKCKALRCHIDNLEERIKQIEQEPCKDMGRYDPYTDTFAKKDYISRQAAIKETLKYTMTSGVTNQGVWNECVQAIADTLANAECLPSVQPKVVPIAEIRFDDDKLHEIVNAAVKNIEIKSERSPVLDKIRAEIEQEYTKFRNRSDMWSERACGLGQALEIIDKYRAESEGRHD